MGELQEGTPGRELDIMTRFEALERDIFGNLESLVDQARALAKHHGQSELIVRTPEVQALFENIKTAFAFSVEQFTLKREALDQTLRELIALNLGKHASQVERLFGIDLQLHVPFEHLMK